MRKLETFGNVSFEREGNTRGITSRVVPCKYWCFTLNNWREEELAQLETIFMDLGKYVIGKEVGEKGTAHLQGYVQLKKKARLNEVVGNKRIHWEKCRGSEEANVKYCTKDNDYVTNMKLRKKVKVIENLYKWQLKIEKRLLKEPDDRSIYWYWSRNGGVGKSQFCKYLFVKHKAFISGGKSGDIKHGIVRYDEEYGDYPSIVVLDIPRCQENFISWEAIESVKNGLFHSGKYEGSQVAMNSPHVICFANFEPDRSILSRDRWVIKEIS